MSNGVAVIVSSMFYFGPIGPDIARQAGRKRVGQRAGKEDIPFYYRPPRIGRIPPTCRGRQTPSSREWRGAIARDCKDEGRDERRKVSDGRGAEGIASGEGKERGAAGRPGGPS